MNKLYPLRFKPIFKRYLWGGRRLETLLAKPIGAGSDYAESWELVDRSEEQSVVEAGPLAGTSLGDLVRQHGPELLGEASVPSRRFPLLVKFLDANQSLSVQVHPNDSQAARLTPPDMGKTEAWVVLAAEPGSTVYAGLKPDVTRPQLEEAIRKGTCAELLHATHPQPGDCIFVPAGTVHALGKGLLVAEIQQSSDVTYRLFDWNRVGPDGKSRPLHIDEGLAVVDFQRGPVDAQPPRATDQSWVSRLVQCDKFVLDRAEFDTPQTIGGDGRCHILIVVEGQIELEGDPTDRPLGRGDTVLLPASNGPVVAHPHQPTILLNSYF